MDHPSKICLGTIAAAGAIFVSSSLGGNAAEIFRSGPEQVALVELYTSEGCSSCPPAERRLNAMRGNPQLWRSVVPVAFHVNYWDGLGWRDVFASKRFTERQYEYAATWSAGQVYTPCFVRNGREWRVFGDDLSRATSDVDEKTPAAGTLTVERLKADVWRAVYQPAVDGAKPGELEVCAVVMGGEIVSRVRAGENAGRELRHEFVALDLVRTALVQDSAGAWTGNVTFDGKSPAGTGRRAIAAWIVRRGNPAPLQATGGWLVSGEP